MPVAGFEVYRLKQLPSQDMPLHKIFPVLMPSYGFIAVMPLFSLIDKLLFLYIFKLVAAIDPKIALKISPLVWEGRQLKYNFEWDPNKAKLNIRKHKVSFERAAEIFPDPFAISVFDDEHSLQEDRWITMGKDSNEVVLVLVHTFKQQDINQCNIRNSGDTSHIS